MVTIHPTRDLPTTNKLKKALKKVSSDITSKEAERVATRMILDNARCILSVQSPWCRSRVKALLKTGIVIPVGVDPWFKDLTDTPRIL